MMDNEVGRSDDDNDDVDEVAEMQQAVPRQQWREEATKDRLIGKMLREVSQFVVVLQPSEDTDDSGGAVGASMEPGALNRVQYVRGNKAVVHTNDFLKLVDANENYETRDLMIQFVKFNCLEKYIPVFSSCSQCDDEVLARNCLSLSILLTKPISHSYLQLAVADKRKKSERASESKDIVMNRRKNVCQQITCLLAIKSALLADDIFDVIMWLVDKPLKAHFLGRKWSDSENIAMERLFLFLRNFLAIGASPLSSPQEAFDAQCIHNRFILMLQKGFINILATTTASLGQERYAQWVKLHVHIIFHLLRGRDAKTLLSIWKSSKLLTITKTEELLSEKQDRPKTSSTSILQTHQHHPQSQTVSSSFVKKPSTGLLQTLKTEKSNRDARVSKFSRFGAIYKVQATMKKSAVGPEGIDSAVEGAIGEPIVHIVHNPLVSFAESLPQAKRKRQKNNLTFAADEDISNAVSGAGSLLDPYDTLAGIVVASFVEHLVKHGFQEFAFSVKSVWRRDLPQMGPEDDLVYYQMASVFVKYRRMQLLMEHSKHLAETPSTGWKPDLRVPLQILDRMTINRAYSNIESLKVAKQFDKIVHPMELFKEVVASIRLFLLSSKQMDHDIAIGVLNRIFYASAQNERIDPLPNLLRDWRPGTYGKKHLFTLVEMVHEAMKTLEEARLLFSSDYGVNATRQVDSISMQQYIAAALKFDPDEYFRKLLSSGTVSLYTRVLENYATNPPHVNHYVTLFLQRMCMQKIEIGIKLPDQGDSQRDLTLAHMLFNIQTIVVFEKILNDTDRRVMKQLEPLVRLIKNLVRTLGELSSKNHLIFVEMLLQHPHAQHFCETMDSVYDAHLYTMQPGKSKSSGFYDSDDDNSDAGSIRSEEELSRQARTEPSVDFEDEHEYDEFEELPSVSRVVAEKKHKKKKQKVKEIQNTKYNSDGETNSDWDSDEEKRKIAKKKKPLKWTSTEDEELREQYEIYAGSRGVFDILAQNDFLSSRGRSAADVENRIKELKLSVPIRKQVQQTAKETVVSSSGGLLWDPDDGDENDSKWNSRSRVLGGVSKLDEVSTNQPIETRKLLKKTPASRSLDDEDDEDLFGDTATFDSPATQNRPKMSMIIDSDED